MNEAQILEMKVGISRIPQTELFGWREVNAGIAFSNGLGTIFTFIPLWKIMVASFLSGFFLILHSSLDSI